MNRPGFKRIRFLFGLSTIRHHAYGPVLYQISMHVKEIDWAGFSPAFTLLVELLLLGSRLQSPPQKHHSIFPLLYHA